MISFDSVSKQYGDSVLLNQASVSFNEKECTGLVGINGSGKTTLLRMLSSGEEVDSGTISKPSDLKIGYLPQEVEILDNKTPLEIVLEPFSNLLNFEQQIQNLSSQINQTGLKTVMNQMDSLYKEMELNDGYSLHARAEAILSGLGIPEQNWSQPVQLLSGGYRMRTILGKLLLESPDFLLLDEPTNHLDMDSLVWLEKFLSKYKGGMLIVSHDRNFLNRITTSTAEICNCKITIYKGNYDQFLSLKQEAFAAAQSRARNLELKIAQNERFVERFKAKASKATQAQSRMKLLEKLRSELPQIKDNTKSIRFKFPEPVQSGTVPITLKDVSAGYDDKTVLENLSLNINRGDKIAIVGPNGAGKSTFLKLLAGLLPSTRGSVIKGANVNFRYFGQHQLEQLDPQKTLYETVIEDSVKTEKTFIRNILGAFLFSGDSVDKTVSVLSGGEKARLVLATILASPGNVLLLDEPTNHLDIASVEILADAMRSFTGTILFVSHDEFFISKTATRIIEIRPGLVRDFPGTLNDYRIYVEMFFGENKSLNSDISAQPVNSAKQDKAQRIAQREERKKLGRTVEKLEVEIEKLEEKADTLHSTLTAPQNASDHQLLHKTNIELENVHSQLNSLVEQWEQKQTELEKYDA
ncbi:MAG: ABC-F family ATP-binding cassette domain-containing protein [Fibrobacter sp.]|nr:ABC-F family ATP-binding cassette domain-containing protein [Fibrobacter sp.]